MDFKQCIIRDRTLSINFQLTINGTASSTIVRVVIILFISLQIFMSKFMLKKEKLFTFEYSFIFENSIVVIITIDTLDDEIISLITFTFIAIAADFLVITDSRCNFMGVKILLCIRMFQPDSISTSY